MILMMTVLALFALTFSPGIIGAVRQIVGLGGTLAGLFGGGEKPESRTLSPQRMQQYQAT
ncbi:unnamed protein product, partial [marine sediment metagenome]